MAGPERPSMPVFYDQERRRWYWIVRLGAAVALAGLLALVCFALSVLSLPLLPHNSLPRVREAADQGNVDPNAADRQAARRGFAARRTQRKLARLALRERRERDAALLRIRRMRAAEERNPALARRPNTVVGFYVNWEETSLTSLRAHVDSLTHLSPEWLHLTRDGRSFTDARTDEDRNEVEPLTHAHGVAIIPVINNYLSRKGSDVGEGWGSQTIHRLLSSRDGGRSFARSLRNFVVRQHWQGIDLDFEQVAEPDRDLLTEFVRVVAAEFHRSGLVVAQCVSVEDPAFDLVQIGRTVDLVIPMVYDEHSPGDEAGAGPIAGIPWTRKVMAEVFRQVPASKVVAGFGTYAYDWEQGDLKAETMTFQAATIQAKESRDPDDPSVAAIHMDPQSLNPNYWYLDDDGKRHTVWLLDAASAYNQWRVADGYHARGVALWYLGAEDPDVWSVLGRDVLGTDVGPAIDGGILNVIRYGGQAEVDFEGDGELLDVIATPSAGRRVLHRSPASGMIVADTYLEYPSAYVVRRYGYRPKQIALTFDDGPDPQYTPAILDILKREGVPATFFVIGKQAEEHPDLVARIWNEGHGIGNHSYTHPNLARTGQDRTLLEIAATQRIIEAITGHTTTLFRPPYAIDVEPRTGDDLRAVMLASERNFLALGEKIDPQDWRLTQPAPGGTLKPRSVSDIVESVWKDRDAGSVLLLHDGGGDRSKTIAALPRIIERLKANGYTFVTVSALSGLPRNKLFPPVSGREQILVGVDRWVFEISYITQRTLVLLFTLSIVLGVSRQFLLAALALIQKRREVQRDKAASASAYTPSVSVVIAAYNEEKVIVQTVQAVLASDYPEFQVIVIDDGSSDDTSGAVKRAFGDDPRVVCVRQPNAGKAAALTNGLALSTGEIIVALDADTLFAPTAIRSLARHFRDPKVGAVAGNVRVGNPTNILTRWQALEYITSQNFDRRAYDLLNCITVVPGAVGAWRKAAIESVGGYSDDTLAEDTDLTWRIRIGGWRVLNDSAAYAYTEVPESVKTLARQRFRWSFGTLQCLWKHRGAMFRHGLFGWFALPSLWLYQIVFTAISPIMDATVVWALVAGNVGHVLFYYVLMLLAEMAGAALAVHMDHADRRLLPWLLLQRFVYRQVMYFVVLKSLWYAIRGAGVGWRKIERTGTARLSGA